MNKTILITGAAGFIGFHITEKLLNNGFNVIGIDNLNNYYDVKLKIARLEQLGINEDNFVCNCTYLGQKFNKRFIFFMLDISDRKSVDSLFINHKIDIVCNLAAQAGVRYSLTNPDKYIDSNIVGFSNILEACRKYGITKIVYASSSSVYGNNKEIPFSENNNVDTPVSLYAASKKSNELMAYSYSHLFNIETIGLRFFTVYGPWGRPDMALFLFTNAILNNKPIQVFNNGDLYRDFTYIDDITNGLYKIILENTKNENKYKIYNIGNSKPIYLIDFIKEIEKCLGIKSKKEMMPMQKGDVYKTYADTSLLEKDYKYVPETTIQKGVSQFINWYKKYYLN